MMMVGVTHHQLNVVWYKHYKCYFPGVTISLAPSTQDVSEGSDAVFTLTASGGSDLPYSVVFQSVDGTAHGMYTKIVDRNFNP